MSKITTIRSYIEGLVAGELAGYAQCANPYVPEANSQLTLAKGFGVGVGPGEPFKTDICPKYGQRRQFNVLLVNLVTSTPSNVAAFHALEDALLEDLHKIRKKLEAEFVLGGAAIQSDYAGDTGIQFLSGDKFKFISVSADYVVLYREDL